MKAYLLARPWLLPLLVVLAAALFFGASALLTTCDTKQPGELSRRQERRVSARRDSALARATRLDQLAQTSAAHAAAAYDSAQVLQDSTLYYRNHETDIIRVPARDTARVQRFLAEYFDL